VERCVRCILPDTYPEIGFDEKGICSFCTDFEMPPLGKDKEEELKRLVEEARLRQGRYQVIVPISGGKDSAYALYVARCLYGLRVLAINFDNGFRSAAAEANLKTLTTQLDIDYVSIKPSWHLMRSLYSAFVKSVGEFCTVCNAMGYLTIMTCVVEEAIRIRSKLLVVGGWSEKLEAMPGMYSFDFKYFHDIIAQAGMSEKLRRSPMINEQCLDILINAPDPRMTTKDADLPFNYVMLPEYIPWDLNQISKTLKKELGWSAPPGAENETHFDCVMYPVAKYFERRKYGFSQNTVTYSALVRAAQMTREQALMRVEDEGEEPPEEFAQFLDTLGLAESEVNWNGRWHPQRHLGK